MLSEAISRAFVEEIPVLKSRDIAEHWYRDLETGDIYSLSEPDPPLQPCWRRIEIENLLEEDGPIQ
jgi:hypothetical protein